MAKTKTLFLKPAEGLLVRDPVTRKPLDPAGEDKPDTLYWRRVLARGDAVRATRPKGGKTAAKEA